MTEHTLSWVRRLQDDQPVDAQISFAGGTDQKMREWIGSDFAYRPQLGGDLGARMSHAFDEAFAGGKRAVIIVGTDCPELDERAVAYAFKQLRHQDLVLGPARDGGFYLIGLRRSVPKLFDRVDWGQDDVLERTLTNARQAGLRVTLLKLLSDVDRPEDLPIWQRAEEKTRGAQNDGGPSLTTPRS
jgi:rSAM/selenodomain-associated transferase 1